MDYRKQLRDFRFNFHFPTGKYPVGQINLAARNEREAWKEAASRLVSVIEQTPELRGIPRLSLAQED